MAERETPGQRIRNLREAAFITQKDFAERIGVAPSQLSRIESGETKTISSDILIAIATEFDVSTDYLLGREYVLQADLSRLPPEVAGHILLLIKDLER